MKYVELSQDRFDAGVEGPFQRQHHVIRCLLSVQLFARVRVESSALAVVVAAGRRERHQVCPTQPIRYDTIRYDILFTLKN